MAKDFDIDFMNFDFVAEARQQLGSNNIDAPSASYVGELLCITSKFGTFVLDSTGQLVAQSNILDHDMALNIFSEQIARNGVSGVQKISDYAEYLELRKWDSNADPLKIIVNDVSNGIGLSKSGVMQAEFGYYKRLMDSTPKIYSELVDQYPELLPKRQRQNLAVGELESASGSLKKSEESVKAIIDSYGLAKDFDYAKFRNNGWDANEAFADNFLSGTDTYSTVANLTLESAAESQKENCLQKAERSMKTAKIIVQISELVKIGDQQGANDIAGNYLMAQGVDPQDIGVQARGFVSEATQKVNDFEGKKKRELDKLDRKSPGKVLQWAANAIASGAAYDAAKALSDPEKRTKMKEGFDNWAKNRSIQQRKMYEERYKGAQQHKKKSP